MQKKCKPNAMELAPIAEMQPFFYKDNANERNESLLSKLPNAAYLLQKYNIFSNNMTKTSIYLL